MIRDLPALWRYIRMDEYSKPPKPAKEAVRRGIWGLWERLRGKSESDEQLIARVNLRNVPPSVLDKAVQEPDWNDAVLALDNVLEEWLNNDHPESCVQVVVGAPHGGTPQIVNRWATARKWNIVEAPAAEQILEGHMDWSSYLDGDQDAPLAIPQLDRFYLRHYNGLALIPRLLNWLYFNHRRCLIGCNSWAWQYLSKALQINLVLPPPFILEPFNHERLQRWFRILAHHPGQRAFEFRRTDSGELVLPPMDEADPSGESQSDADKRNSKSSEKTSDFLNYLAGHSQGIPGVARAVWRHYLRVAPEYNRDTEAKKLSDIDNEHTLWVEPWPQVKLPAIPYTMDRAYLMALHAIILHDGLSEKVLTLMLPLSSGEISWCLLHLHAAGLLQINEGIWQIAPLGYPAVHEYLGSEGYLIGDI